MSLERSIEGFKQACLAIAPNSRFSHTSKADLAPTAKYLPISEDLYSWYALAAPQNVVIDWTANQLELFSPSKLLEYQLGYRWQGVMSFEPNKLEKLDDWTNEWIVIGWVGGDPIIAKVDESPNPILMAYHGEGDWNPEPIAPSLERFFDFLSQWCKLLEEYGGRKNIFDANSEILPEVLERLRKITQEASGEQYSENLMKFLWG